MDRKHALVLLATLVAGVTALTPRSSEAFCGFYVAGADAKLFNNATVVVLMRDGTRTVLSMQNDYQGPPEDFALVIPVPVVLQEGDVKTLRKQLFERVDRLAAPRLVEYWELDPCAPELVGLGKFGLSGKGSGGGTGPGYGRGSTSSTVTIEAQFEVGEYEIVILSATESNGLDSWLRESGYNIPAGAEPLLRPYVEQGMKFFVAKVDPNKVQFGANGRAMLSPLRFHYDSDEFALPVRLGLINAPDPASGGKQDLLVHIVAPNTRYQLANYPNVTIPTNLDLQDSARDRFGEFYVALFDRTIAHNPGAVVTEYAWAAGDCDPCPDDDAPLSNQELLELGADVLPNWSNRAASAPGRQVPRIRLGLPTVVGMEDKDVIRRIVRAHLDEVRSCYDAGLVANASLAGRMVVEFTIGGEGKVSSATVGESTLADPSVEQCVAKAVERWTYPKPRGGDVVEVQFPFELSPTGGDGTSVGDGSVASSFVLTRLHARYDASALGEDLVFEAAPPVVGGRELPGHDDQLEHGSWVGLGGRNNFQARYAIRHAWTGAIECEEPVRGRWGGPPDGSRKPPTVARQLTEVERGMSLASFLTADASHRIDAFPLPSIDVEVEIETREDQPAAVAPAPTPAESDGSKPAGGCTCSTGERRGEPSAALFGLLVLLGLGGLHSRDRSCKSADR
ncbi:MAG TPA: DUF2330 domain-containing protein [Enhygromyxa sp.]|nr:DUF2330 domain-containing protein [Enhygromyxa sp.]